MINIDRKQRREFNGKEFARDRIASLIHGLTKLDNIFNTDDSWIKEGEKVKLNVEKIKIHKDYKRLTEGYKDFISNNADTIFTVKFEEKYGEYPSLVTFQEDSTWLFHVGDLIRL